MDENKNPWTTHSGEEKYDNPWINVTEYQVTTPGGTPGIYGKVHFKNEAIGIIPLDEDYNTYLVGQYRYTIDQYSWEIPEGGGPVGTKALDNAKRELLEETGITAKTWIPIQEMHVTNCATDEYGIIFIAQDLTYGEAQPEDSEELQVKKVPFNEAYEMVLKGEIMDALTILAILKTKIMIDKGEI